MARKSAADDRQLSLLSPHVTRTSLTLPSSLSFDDWADMGRALKLCGSALGWWVGDWVIQGEERFKDKAIQVIEEITGLDPGTIATRQSVCRAFPKARRRQLSFEHHKEVYMLTEKQQEKWLDKAVEGHMTRAELRGAIKNAGLRKTKKRGAVAQTKPTTELYNDLKESIGMVLQLVPPLVELFTTVNEQWEERMPTPQVLDMMERTNEEFLQALHKAQANVLELEGVEAKPAGDDEASAA